VETTTSSTTATHTHTGTQSVHWHALASITTISRYTVTGLTRSTGRRLPARPPLGESLDIYLPPGADSGSMIVTTHPEQWLPIQFLAA
jgi:hypothetical protein